MKNILRTASLAFALALGALPGCGSASEGAGDVQNATEKGGRFELFVGQDAQHYFQLLAENGERVLRSEGYTTLANAKKGIASVRANGVSEANFQILAASNGESYINLV